MVETALNGFCWTLFKKINHPDYYYQDFTCVNFEKVKDKHNAGKLKEIQKTGFKLFVALTLAEIYHIKHHAR